MRTLDDWLAEYSESHRDPVNRRYHRVCVPLILWSVVGFLSLLRLYDGVLSSAAMIGSAFALGFYALLGAKPFVQMFLLLGACIAACASLDRAVERAWIVYAIVFALGWAGQAIGHVHEGKKPSFFKDVQFLLIGPLWILRRH
jgi:uncharacterized membrane protein YGL010W